MQICKQEVTKLPPLKKMPQDLPGVSSILKPMNYLSRNVRKRTSKQYTQRRFRSACAFAQSDQNLHWRFWIVKDAKFLHADNEDSNQTAPMRRLIWIFGRHANRKVRFLTFRFLFIMLITLCIRSDFFWQNQKENIIWLWNSRVQNMIWILHLGCLTTKYEKWNSIK